MKRDFNRLNTESSEKDQEGKKDKDGKKLPLAVLVTRESAPKPKTVTLDTSAFNEVLAALTKKKPEKAAAEEPQEASQDKPETIDLQTESAEKSVGAGEQDTDGYETLLVYDRKSKEVGSNGLLKNERYVGEMVISLHDPASEALRTETKTVAEEAPASTALEATDEQSPQEPEVDELAAFFAQPEQQHMAHEQEETTPPVAGGGGEVPPTLPPETAFGFAEQPPEQPRHTVEGEQFEQVYRDDMQRQAERQMVLPSESGITQQQLEDEVYYATRKAQNRGVLAGMAYGYIKHHRGHEKKLKNEAKQQTKAHNKQLEAARQSYRSELDEHAERQNETKKQLNAAERRYTTAERRLQDRAQPEKQPTPVAPEQLQPAEQLEVPPEHTLQTSAWLTTEVDRRTGQAVENPTFQYGEEYDRERAQELMAAQQQQHTAVAGEAAVMGATGASGQSTGSSATPATDDGVLPPPYIPNATMRGAPPTTQQQSAQQAQPAPDSDVPSKPLWPWLIALAVVVICLIAVF